MDEVSKSGRTILFVSHQMGTIAQLCQRTILLERGAVAMNDKTSVVIEHYVNQNKTKDAFLRGERGGGESGNVCGKRGDLK